MEKLKRYIIFFIGLYINSLGVALITKASLGTSPISSIPYVLSLNFPFTLGNFTIFFSLFLIFLQLLILRKNFFRRRKNCRWQRQQPLTRKRMKPLRQIRNQKAFREPMKIIIRRWRMPMTVFQKPNLI